MTLGNTVTFDELMNGNNLRENQLVNGPSWCIISLSMKSFSADYVGWRVFPYKYTLDLSNTTWKEIQSFYFIFFKEREYGVDLPCNLYFRTFSFLFFQLLGRLSNT